MSTDPKPGPEQCEHEEGALPPLCRLSVEKHVRGLLKGYLTVFAAVAGIFAVTMFGWLTSIATSAAERAAQKSMEDLKMQVDRRTVAIEKTFQDEYEKIIEARLKMDNSLKEFRERLKKTQDEAQAAIADVTERSREAHDEAKRQVADAAREAMQVAVKAAAEVEAEAKKTKESLGDIQKINEKIGEAAKSLAQNEAFRENITKDLGDELRALVDDRLGAFGARLTAFEQGPIAQVRVLDVRVDALQQAPVGLGGKWTIGGNPTRIVELGGNVMILENERQVRVRGVYQPVSRTIVVTTTNEWSAKTGTVSPDMATIRWSDGATWQKEK